jgi:hypothetical protein
VQAYKTQLKEVGDYTEDMKKILLTTGQWFLSKDMPVFHENI